MSGSLGPGRTDSLPSRLNPTPDSCYDTALPPMSSKQLVPRRSLRGSESSIVMQSVRASNNRAPPTLYPHDSMPMLARGASAHRRTGSTLKTVMRRIFTRKGRSQTDSFDDEPDDFRLASGQLSSATPQDSHNSLTLPKSMGSKKASSPLLEENETPFPIHSTLQQLESRPHRPRRATLPSLVFSDEGSHVGGGGAHRDSDRMPGTSRAGDLLAPDQAERRRELMRSKRRSRSAGQLRGMAKDHRMSPIQWRRRSVESYVGSTTHETTVSDSELSYRPPTRTTVASAPKEPTKPSSVYETDDQEDDDEGMVIPPNVGTLVNAMQNNEDIPLEQRVATLEVKLIDLEFAIARMQGGGGGGRSEPSPTTAADTSASAPKKLRPSSRQHRRKKSTSHSPSSARDDSPGLAVSGTERPLSTATIKASHNNTTPSRPRMPHTPSSTSLSDYGNGISVEQYSALVTLLRREQTARRNLEGEVSGLRDDIQQLQRMARDSMGMGVGVGVGTMYPIRDRAESNEFEFSRYRHGGSDSNSPRTDEKVGSYESDSDWEGRRSRDDVFRPRWTSSRRVEVGGMI